MRIESVICQFQFHDLIPPTVTLTTHQPYKQEDIVLTMYVLFTSLKYYCIFSFSISSFVSCISYFRRNVKMLSENP